MSGVLVVFIENGGGGVSVLDGWKSPIYVETTKLYTVNTNIVFSETPLLKVIYQILPIRTRMRL